jgi:hypothetical protein
MSQYVAFTSDGDKSLQQCCNSVDDDDANNIRRTSGEGMFPIVHYRLFVVEVTCDLEEARMPKPR